MKFIFLIIIVLNFLVSCGKERSVLTTEVSEKSGVSSELSSRWKMGKSVFPLSLKVNNDFSVKEKNSIKAAAFNWGQAIDYNTDLFKIEETSQKNNRFELNAYKDNELGIYKIYDWDSELPASALAVTQIYGNRFGSYIEIEHADILINYDYFDFDEDVGYGHDLQTVLAHEMGHFLGLFHENTSLDDSIMYPSITRFTINRNPKFKDASNVMNIYQIGSNSNQERSIFKSQNNVKNEKGIPVVMRQELLTNGNCRHLENGKVVYEHK